MPKPLTVVAAGTGYFSQFHYDAWARLPGVRLAALASLDLEAAAGVAATHEVPQIYESVGKMLDRERPDLLDIITPPATHLELVREAALRGVPVICQKPLAPTFEEAEAVVRTAEDAGVMLAVHENFRFMPWFLQVRRFIEAGRLGTPHSIHFRMRPGDGQGPRAYLNRQPYFQAMERFFIHETGIHFVDVFRYLLGEVSDVTARLRRINPVIAGEDAGYVIFTFADGASGLLDGNRLNDHVADDCRLTMGEMHLEGSNGVLRLDGFGHLWWKPHGGAEAREPYAWQAQGFGGDCVHALQSHVVEHMTSGAKLVNSGRDYLTNLRIEEAIYLSSAEGRRISLTPATQ